MQDETEVTMEVGLRGRRAALARKLLRWHRLATLVAAFTPFAMWWWWADRTQDSWALALLAAHVAASTLALMVPWAQRRVARATYRHLLQSAEEN